MVVRKMMFFFLCLGQPISVHAKDFGVHGMILSIEEHDPIVLIQSKLKTMEERGELERHNFELQKKTRAAIERPKPVEGISKATKNRVFYYDPTYIVPEDIKDHHGQIIHPKGTRINPLETVSLSQGLLFFDGDDEDQVAFAKEKSKEASPKLILTKGTPLALSEELTVPVYFDQSELLTKKLGIQHVPTLVTQDELRLRIEEISLKEQED
ncbi:MAG: type-F conjugative transfer system protein TraW [Alphaproteobacteria bacterium]|nr:type-F conjugative transfer system protein TraW [Alphaproteobacteria bacterium]MBP9776766.1 type-F conjugative transfer system protein TraW [Alphaproteobacteria bacterium]